MGRTARVGGPGGRAASQRAASQRAASQRAALAEVNALLRDIEQGAFGYEQQQRMLALLPQLPEAFRLELAEVLAAVEPAPPPIPFREFVTLAKPDYRWYEFAERIHDRLMDVAEGRLRRLMIFAPPRHGKSELVSRLFSAYYQYRYPHRWVGLCSYGSDLAFMLARNSRDNYVRAGGHLGSQRDHDAVRTISTGKAGGMWAAGVGGPITGKGFHLGIVDDPLKNSEEAKSVTIREKHKDWWKGTFYTRKEPNAAVIIIMTPWHEDDLANWLLRRETADENSHPERWHIIALDALRDTRQPFFKPATCTLEPDPRREGEALAPDRYPREELLKVRQSTGTYYWSAMFQARPRPEEGVMFKRHWFRTLGAMPRVGIVAAVRYWDLAATDKGDATEHDPDFTRSILCLAVRMVSESDTAGTGTAPVVFVLADGTGGQFSPMHRDNHIKAVTERDAELFGKGTVVTWMERDSGGGGKDRTKALVAKLAGHRVRTEPALGQSKELRAEPLRDQAEAGNVAVVEGMWTTAFLEELCGFPYGTHDDYVDAAVGAFVKCSDMVGVGASDAVPQTLAWTMANSPVAIPGALPMSREGAVMLPSMPGLPGDDDDDSGSRYRSVGIIGA